MRQKSLNEQGNYGRDKIRNFRTRLRNTIVEAIISEKRKPQKELISDWTGQGKLEDITEYDNTLELNYISIKKQKNG